MCPNYLAIDAAIQAAKGSQVAIGAQDVYWEKEGAFTGEVSTGMLVAAGVTTTLSSGIPKQPAQISGETDDTGNLKLKPAVEVAGSIRIVCVGEVSKSAEANFTRRCSPTCRARAPLPQAFCQEGAPPGVAIPAGLGDRQSPEANRDPEIAGRSAACHYPRRSRGGLRRGIPRRKTFAYSMVARSNRKMPGQRLDDHRRH